MWNWFNPKGAFDNDYIFAAFVGRGALQWKDDRFDVMVEAQNSSLVSLPDKASAPAPQGSLGLGAVYFAHNRREDDSHFFLKQGFVLFKNLGLEGLTLKGGRFEFSEGNEVLTKEPTLDWPVWLVTRRTFVRRWSSRPHAWTTQSHRDGITSDSGGI